MEYLQEKIKKDLGALWEMIQAEVALKDEINKDLSAYVERNRRFAVGEVIWIYDVDTDTLMGRGVVGDAKTSINTEPLYLKEYIKNEDACEKRINLFRYEVFAVKKDGTKSTKHFFTHPHFLNDQKRHGDVYIKKIEADVEAH